MYSEDTLNITVMVAEHPAMRIPKLLPCCLATLVHAMSMIGRFSDEDTYVEEAVLRSRCTGGTTLICDNLISVTLELNK